MRHTLKLNGIVIGWSLLEEVDSVDRRAWGQFHPGIGYELVELPFDVARRARLHPRQGAVLEVPPLGDVVPVELLAHADPRTLQAAAHTSVRQPVSARSLPE